MSIASNLKSIQREIHSVTSRPIAILAAVKNRSREEISEAIAAGITNIGENRVQEAKTHDFPLPAGVLRHFIGRLQSNKVKDAVRLFDVIQSVDSMKLAEIIDRECEKTGKTMTVFIEVNTSGEAQKGGIEPEDARALMESASKLKHIHIEGLMTMAINSDDENAVRACFRRLKALFDDLKNNPVPELS